MWPCTHSQLHRLDILSCSVAKRKQVQLIYTLSQLGVHCVQTMVRTLMKLGLRADVPDASGRTALDVARRRAHDPAHDPLLQFMARTQRVQALQSQGRQRRRAASTRTTVSSLH